MNKITTAIPGIICILLLSFLYVHIGKQLQLQDMRDTYKICIVAHNQFDGESEQKCGDSQDRTNTEFMCNQTGNYCWLEVK